MAEELFLSELHNGSDEISAQVEEKQPLNCPENEERRNDFSQLRRMAVVAVVAALAILEGACMSLPGPFFPPDGKNHGREFFYSYFA